jgi:hypothetical protein
MLTAMANNPVELTPLVPRGFILCNRSQEEDTPQWVFVFLGTFIQRIDEDVAILEPVVNLIDYP